MQYYMKSIATPVGKLILVTTEKSVVALVWNKSELDNLGFPTLKEGQSCPLLKKAEKQLGEYLRGRRKSFDLPLETLGTEFQKRVWTGLRKIPFGKTWSYQELAKRAGSPRAVRAAGSANGKNSICIIIPCHRVIRLTGELGGYTGGVDKKAYLLALESGKP